MSRSSGDQRVKVAEWHLFQEKEIERAVKERRLDQPKSGNSSGRIINNPTEARALKDIAPLKSVVLSNGSEVFHPEKWLEAIKQIYSGLVGVEYKLAEYRYRQGKEYIEICTRLHISQGMYYILLNRVRGHMLAITSQMGLIRKNNKKVIL